MGVAVIVGLIFLIVPGIYLMLRLMFVPILVVDRELTAREALSASWDATRGHTGFLFLFFLTTLFANIIGLLALGVGLLISLPTTAMAQMAVYNTLAVKPASKKKAAKK